MCQDSASCHGGGGSSILNFEIVLCKQLYIVITLNIINGNNLDIFTSFFTNTLIYKQFYYNNIRYNIQ